MRYVTSVERLAREKGLEEGRNLAFQEIIEQGLKCKFGAAGLQLMPAIRGIHDPVVLRGIRDTLFTAISLNEIQALIKE